MFKQYVENVLVGDIDKLDQFHFQFLKNDKIVFSVSHVEERSSLGRYESLRKRKKSKKSGFECESR